MNKYIVIAFAFMGFGFYELSGGSGFQPGTNSLTIFAPAPPPVSVSPVVRDTIVARADTTAPVLTDITPVRRETTPAIETIDRTEPVVAATTPDPAPVVPVAAVIEAPAVVEDAAVATTDLAPDLRFVDADRVNLRGGPGTDYAVVGRLLRDDMVEIIKDEGNGWLHLRVPATGDEGWMADWLVTAAN